MYPRINSMVQVEKYRRLQIKLICKTTKIFSSLSHATHEEESLQQCGQGTTYTLFIEWRGSEGLSENRTLRIKRPWPFHIGLFINCTLALEARAHLLDMVATSTPPMYEANWGGFYSSDLKLTGCSSDGIQWSQPPLTTLSQITCPRWKPGQCVSQLGFGVYIGVDMVAADSSWFNTI